MTPTTRPTRVVRELRRELLAAAVAGAREGGRRGVVLREAARAANVSPAAAYRHFHGYDDLLGSVCAVADQELGETMAREMAAVPSAGAPADRADRMLRATGRGYLRFAVAQPGLFDCLVSTAPQKDAGAGALALLAQALDACVAAATLSPADRVGAEALAWIGVHGLAMQAIQGVQDPTAAGFDDLVERTLSFIARGVGVRPPVST